MTPAERAEVEELRGQIANLQEQTDLLRLIAVDHLKIIAKLMRSETAPKTEDREEFRNSAVDTIFELRDKIDRIEALRGIKNPDG